MKTEYKVLEAFKLVELVNMVNTYLNNGWVLQGGVAPVSNGLNGETKYLQAMTRTESE